MKRFVFLFAAALAGPAFGYGFTWSGGTTARLGSKVISAGDKRAKVLDAGGNPARRTDITGDAHEKIGERWIYKSGNGRYTVIDIDNDGIVRGVQDVIGR